MKSNEKSSVNKTISILNRLSHMYFDRQLEPYQIGSGQQFFLYRVYHHPGCNLWELAKDGAYDKGTTTRAVRKLEEAGYLRRVISTEDKRYHQLYITDLAKPLIPIIEKIMHEWNEQLTEGLNDEQQIEVLELLDQLAFNALKAVRKERKKDTE